MEIYHSLLFIYISGIVLDISTPDSNCVAPCDTDEDCDSKLGRPCLVNFSPELIKDATNLVHKEDLKFGVRSNACKYFFQNYQVRQKKNQLLIGFSGLNDSIIFAFL